MRNGPAHPTYVWAFFKAPTFRRYLEGKKGKWIYVPVLWIHIGLDINPDQDFLFNKRKKKFIKILSYVIQQSNKYRRKSILSDAGNNRIIVNSKSWYLKAESKRHINHLFALCQFSICWVQVSENQLKTDPSESWSNTGMFMNWKFNI